MNQFGKKRKARKPQIIYFFGEIASFGMNNLVARFNIAVCFANMYNMNFFVQGNSFSHSLNKISVRRLGSVRIPACKPQNTLHLSINEIKINDSRILLTRVVQLIIIAGIIGLYPQLIFFQSQNGESNLLLH